MNRVVIAKVREAPHRPKASLVPTVHLDLSQIMKNLVANRMEMKIMTTAKVPKVARAPSHPRVTTHRHHIGVNIAIIRTVVTKVLIDNQPQVMVLI